MVYAVGVKGFEETRFARGGVTRMRVFFCSRGASFGEGDFEEDVGSCQAVASQS